MYTQLKIKEQCSNANAHIEADIERSSAFLKKLLSAYLDGSLEEDIVPRVERILSDNVLIKGGKLTDKGKYFLDTEMISVKESGQYQVLVLSNKVTNDEDLLIAIKRNNRSLESSEGTLSRSRSINTRVYDRDQKTMVDMDGRLSRCK